MTKRVQFVFDERSLVSVEKLKRSGVEVMTVETKSKRVFLRNYDSGEPAAYCGLLSDKADVIKSIGYILDNELDLIAQGTVNDVELRIEVAEMSDAEVEALLSI